MKLAGRDGLDALTYSKNEGMERKGLSRLWNKVKGYGMRRNLNASIDGATGSMVTAEDVGHVD